MLSDTSADAESAIDQYQTEWAGMYRPLTAEINEIRCRMVPLQMKLDRWVPSIGLNATRSMQSRNKRIPSFRIYSLRRRQPP